MTILLAVAAVVLLFVVLGSLSRSGSAALLGRAPFGSDSRRPLEAGERPADPDLRRARADLAALIAHESR